ncbi:MAG TPA: efflux RND transporter periplasmic adaptor subunit [Tepidisphaeraceae bacterium]|nr:efflux RND transporter periplasmic adaptor subunit [Tepidisphaeraceae bacterium]
MRKFLRIFLIILVVLVGLGFLVNWWIKKNMSSGPEIQTVRVEPVMRGNLIETISAPGEVEPKSKVSISARVAARITELPFKEGDRVTKGSATTKPSVLVKLDDTELAAALLSAQARHAAQQAQIRVNQQQIAAARSRVAATRVTLAEANRDLKRQLELGKDVATAVIEQAQSKVDELVAQLRAAEESITADETGLEVMTHNLDAAAAEIARAKDNLSYTIITSPIDGVVTRLNAEVGELVVTGTMNNAGTVIMEVADLSQMLLNTRVDETSIADVQVGQKATVRMEAYREKIFEGTVVAVALANFDPNMSRGGGGNRFMMGNNDGTKFYKTEILLKTNGQRIFSGLTADIDIETKRWDNVLKIPSQAVLGREVDNLPPDVREQPEVDKTKTTVPVVYRVIDGKAVVTPVSIGGSDLTHTVIKSGLTESDVIITGPFKVLESVQNDQKVKEERATTRPTTKPATTMPTPKGA